MQQIRCNGVALNERALTQDAIPYGSKEARKHDAVMTCSPGPLALPQINVPRFPGLSYSPVRNSIRVSNKATN